jgi:hypothetical protein
MQIHAARSALVAEVIRQGGLDADIDRIAGGERVQLALRIGDPQLKRGTDADITRWAIAYCTAKSWREVGRAA